LLKMFYFMKIGGLACLLSVVSIAGAFRWNGPNGVNKTAFVQQDSFVNQTATPNQFLYLRGSPSGLMQSFGVDLDNPSWYTTRKGRLAAATLTAMSISADDLVWLLPFMLCKRWISFGIFYMCCRLFNLTICVLLNTSIQNGLHTLFPTHNVEKIIELCAVILLTLYGGKLFFDWRREREEYRLSQEESLQPGGKSKEVVDPAANLTYVNLFVMTQIGSVDGLVIYTPLLAAKTVGVMDLYIGDCASALTVVLLLGLGVTICEQCCDYAKYLPLWVVVAAWDVSNIGHLLLT